ncbi:hypothetical protein BC938DRAFT_480365 [Jimgerdemannia flammicorona]|uniref:Uncharacterized protein n=1 Tax=Jimgerdemannia flammicorona TaxID=994334 RepID=A0A433QIU9_9FUNG|nr:hypothetical protein BC938DRAFT_480365 [Jimgerdemannia flammicorona]
MRVKHCYFRPAKLLAPSRPEKENPPQKSFENDLEFGIFDAAWVFSGHDDFLTDDHWEAFHVFADSTSLAARESPKSRREMEAPQVLRCHRAGSRALVRARSCISENGTLNNIIAGDD